jgi:hypothetical protein
MVQKQKGQKTYRTMQGKQVDMDMLRKKNELTHAVGNARVNARGDELGPGGKIVRKREDLVKEYYENNRGIISEKAVKKDAPEKDLTDDWVEPESQDDWIEDEEGNFVKKGE